MSEDELALPAEALVQTNLDIPGDVLELPFAACAFVFNDAPTLELARALIHRHSTAQAVCRTLTVYAFPSHNEAEPGFDFVCCRHRRVGIRARHGGSVSAVVVRLAHA